MGDERAHRCRHGLQPGSAAGHRDRAGAAGGARAGQPRAEGPAPRHRAAADGRAVALSPDRAGAGACDAPAAGDPGCARRRQARHRLGGVERALDHRSRLRRLWPCGADAERRGGLRPRRRAGDPAAHRSDPDQRALPGDLGAQAADPARNQHDEAGLGADPQTAAVATDSVHPLPLWERVARMSEAKFSPGEGHASAYQSAETDPSPGFALTREPTLSHRGEGTPAPLRALSVKPAFGMVQFQHGWPESPCRFGISDIGGPALAPASALRHIFRQRRKMSGRRRLRSAPAADRDVFNQSEGNARRCPRPAVSMFKPFSTSTHFRGSSG
ncbi:hypothetical protein BRAS3843_3110009 [Bradyrhizobium sp. STM 3843]|nr:hypothetical protein BRAS3843_3110009 [Bradyrhizobium sp. STM 3843]